MNRVLLLLIGFTVLISCSKKTHPAANKGSKAPVSTTHPETLPSSPPPVTMASPMIVINESGKVITSRDKLPADIAPKVDYSKISRSFTPAQRQNLIYRFKMVPPRVLYVPEQLTSKTARGTYVVYKKKFWYWKKKDGLFHLDETYYQ